MGAPERERGDSVCERALERVSEGFVSLDPDLRITYVNAGAERLLDAPEADLRGESVWDHLPEAAGADARTAIETAEETGKERSFEFDDATGERWYEGRVYPADDGCSLVFVDITEHAERERELERQNDRLEAVASVVSHDFRNPLNVAVSRLELAQRENDSDHLDSARDALDRIKMLIEDTVALARRGQRVEETRAVAVPGLAKQCWRRIDAGRASLVVDTGDESVVVDAEDASFGFDTGDATLGLTAPGPPLGEDAGGSPPGDAEETRDDAGFAVVGDPNRLELVFENLFQNAVTHGSEEVTVRLGPLEEGFYVADDGPGVDPDDRTEVFDPGLTTAPEGTGFGLAIVQEIVDAHGWSVSITDSDDGGARFEITGVEVVE